MTLDRSDIGCLGCLGIYLFKSSLMYSNGTICHIKLLFKGLVAGCHSFCLFWFYNDIHTFNHNTFIRRHSLKPISISSSLVCSVGKTSLWCQAENQTRACLTASRRAAIWATPHHKSYAAPLSHAAPYTFYTEINVQPWDNSICLV